VDDGKDVEALLHQGYVLGQALMEDIARMHHGKFCAIREDGKGTESALYIPMGRNHFEHDKNVTFVANISAPITEGEPLIIPVHSNIEGEEDAEVAGIPQTKYQVLVVEDHKDTRTFLKLQLGNDYTVHLARNGQEGLEKAKKVLPDLIVTEVDLSGVNGYELTRYIKEDADMCHIPVILMTTLTDNEDIIKGMELGADDYIRKPYDVEVLKSKIKRLIKNRIELKRAYTKLLIPVADTDASACENQSLEKNNMEDPLITKMIKLINDNIQNEDFSVKKLAEMLNMSQPTLYRKVKLLTNFTLVEIVRGVRLKKAAELLKSKKYNVQEAAEAVGYNDIPTFRKHFVDLYGITPSAFSKENSSEKK
jgi:DNA-binding response OmpR family regulator